MNRRVRCEFSPGYIEWLSPSTYPLEKITYGLLMPEDKYEWQAFSWFNQKLYLDLAIRVFNRFFSVFYYSFNNI